MGLFRSVRKLHKIRVDGPAVITIISGRASVTIEAERNVKIDHDKPGRQPVVSKDSLTRRPPSA
jgi:hypothetical protein